MDLLAEPSKLNLSTELPSSVQNLPIEIQNDQKRRSSSRSIKRKKFDDEIVEFSIGNSPTQPNYFAQPRTHSFTNTQNLDPLLVSTPISERSPPGSLSSGQGLQYPSQVSIPYQQSMEKRKPLRGRRSKRPGRPPNQTSTRGLGRWKPIDDLALIIGIQQTNDLRMVHRGTKFSCKFTVQELQARWYSLLYEESISRIAVAAMRNLHPELVESVQRRALFTTQEEDILGTIKSTENPKLENFQELLDKNASVFYVARTAKSLQTHWNLMKQYRLLPDQPVKSLLNCEQPLSFSDAEDTLVDADLPEHKDENIEMELSLIDRCNKREIRHLENEIPRWSVLVDSLSAPGIAPEFDAQTLAVLRGRLVRYLMRSKEITFGRDAKEFAVDVNLGLEGPAFKVSRKQGTIKLRSNGDFFICNEGKRPIFIKGVPLLTGRKTRLANNYMVEIAGLRFVFLINYNLINAIRHESAKTTAPLN